MKKRADPLHLFLENHDTQNFASQLNNVVLTYIGKECELGLPVDFREFLYTYMELLQVLQMREDS